MPSDGFAKENNLIFSILFVSKAKSKLSFVPIFMTAPLVLPPSQKKFPVI
jgi:hypothetical protein